MPLYEYNLSGQTVYLTQPLSSVSSPVGSVGEIPPTPGSYATPSQPASNSSWSDWVKWAVEQGAALYSSKQNKPVNPKNPSSNPYVFGSGQSGPSIFTLPSGGSGISVPLIAAGVIGLVVILMLVRR